MRLLAVVVDTGGDGFGPRPSSWLLVVVGAVIGPFDVNASDPLDTFSLLVLVQVVGAARGAPRGLQQSVVRATPILGLIQQDVEGLLIDSGLWKLHLRVEDRPYRTPSSGRHWDVLRCLFPF